MILKRNLRSSKTHFIFISLVFFIIYLTPISQSCAFTLPETLHYRLMYANIKVGESTLRIEKEGDNIAIFSDADSSGIVSIFFNVTDRVKSTLTMDDDGKLIPLSYRLKLKEGGYKRDKEVTFDLTGGKITSQDFIKKTTQSIDISADFVDPLTGIYILRDRELEIGRSEFIKVYDTEKFWDVEIQVLRKQTVKTPAGTFDTIVVCPLLQSEGIFKKSGPVEIFITDDERKIPVRMLTKVSIGTVIAELIEIK